MKAKDVSLSIQQIQNPQKAAILQRFFKTGKGEYAEGDIFSGLTVPQSRVIAKKYKDLELSEIENLLHSKIHEERLIALLILIEHFKKNKHEQKEIFEMYLQNTKYINNWDLVDLSAPNVVGMYLADKKRNVLYELAKSHNLWEKRISILSTLAFIVKKMSMSIHLKSQIFSCVMNTI